MVLYAAGLNAWNQLQFETPSVDEPDDISSFTCVLREDAIDYVRPFLSYTQVHIKDGVSRVAGMVPKDHEKLQVANERTYTSFVEASNGVVVVHDGKQTLNQYPSIRNLLSNDNNTFPLTFPNLPNITQLVAYDTGFAALSATGQVRTWGDERYTACLGREPTDDSPAQIPSLVTDLDDLPTGPITKLAAGGYLLAALTAGHDLYYWGHAGRAPFLGDLSDTPTPLVINDNDIADMAVGEAHMLVLTLDGDVYVIGDNANGQLGLPGVSSAKTWTRIDLGSILDDVGQAAVVTGVAAGPRNSFLMVRKQPE